MFTFGVIAFIIGVLAFLISLFCLIVGKIMGIGVKSTAIITLVCLVTAVIGLLCMGPISITRGTPSSNTSQSTQSAHYDYSNETSPTYNAFESSVEAATSNNSTYYETSIDDTLSDIEAIGNVDVDKRLFSVTLTVPKDFVGETTQTELDAVAKERGYKSATLNSDGSVTYVMSKAQHRELVDSVAESIDESIAEMIGSSEYPNIVDIRANADYTNYTVVTKSVEVNLVDSFVALGLYTFGGMYGVFSGDRVDNVHIDFVNADSGEIIGTANSADME